MLIISFNTVTVPANVGVLENENSLTVKINEESDLKKIKNKKLTFKTFKKWPLKEDFPAETDEEGYIMSLVCKVFCDNLAHEMKLD